MRGLSGLMLCLLALVARERSARAEDSAVMVRLGNIVGGSISGLVPVVHVEFGDHPATMLAWPLRPVTLAAELYRRDKDHGVELRLTPDLEMQYSFAGARRLLLLMQAALGFTTYDRDIFLLTLEGGRRTATDGDGWTVGAGVSAGYRWARNGEAMSVGLIGRRSRVGDASRFDLGLDFHLGFDLML